MNKLFGTDGIRNTVGKHPFTKQTLPNLGKAISQWAMEKYGNNFKLLLAHDTRNSVSWVKAQLKAGLLEYPIKITDAHILPTPALLHIIQTQNVYDFGIIVSASHNPYTDNGIKIIDAKTGKLTIDDENRISEILLLIENNSESPSYHLLGNDEPLKNAEELYINTIVNLFKPDFLKGFSIALDLAHGATYNVAPKIFEKLGAKLTLINNDPNGFNINENCGATNIKHLQETVVKSDLQIGFAFDGDGDRVIAINKQGHVKDGDDILAILSKHPEYQNTPTIVGTVMANQALEDYFKADGKTFIRTPVGDKHVLESLTNQNLILGGEQSGHIVLKNVINTGDGILVALKLLEVIIATHNWEMKTFDKYPQVIVNIPVNKKKELSESPFSELISEYAKKLQPGRLLVRYSGTENKLRIMVEGQNEILTKNIANNLAKLLERLLNS